MRIRNTNRRLHTRRANVLILVTISLTALLGIVALALDGGGLLDERQRVQAAADAAALAAATDLFNNYPTNSGKDPKGTASQSAITTAAANGFSSANATITVNIPPKSGPFADNTKGYVEVIIQYSQPRLFSNIWGGGDSTVKARSVARGQQTDLSSVGLLVLDPHVKNALEIGSTGSAIVKGGGSIAVNSDNSSAVYLGSTGNAQANDIYLTGNYQYGGSGQIIGAIHTSSTPVPDPLATLPVPSPDTMPVRSSSKLQIYTDTTLQPGVYTGGIVVNGGNVTMAPGTYYINGGGMDMSASLSLTANGVFIYNAGATTADAINLDSTGSLNVTPPASGTYQGMTIFQQRNLVAVLQIGGHGNVNTVNGTIYAPGSQIHVTTAGSLIASQLIGNVVEVDSTGDVTIDISGPLHKGRQIQIVE